MPTDDRVRPDDGQALVPAAAEPARQDPQNLVPGPKPSAWSGSGWPRQDGKLMAQEQVLEHKVLVRTYPGQDVRDQQPEQFEHTFSVADSAAVRGSALPQQ
jgi:hypothetical protein